MIKVQWKKQGSKLTFQSSCKVWLLTWDHLSSKFFPDVWETWMILTRKRLLVDRFLSCSLSKSLAFCKFASVHFEPWEVTCNNCHHWVYLMTLDEHACCWYNSTSSNKLVTTGVSATFLAGGQTGTYAYAAVNGRILTWWNLSCLLLIVLQLADVSVKKLQN